MEHIQMIQVDSHVSVRQQLLNDDLEGFVVFHINNAGAEPLFQNDTLDDFLCKTECSQVMTKRRKHDFDSKIFEIQRPNILPLRFKIPKFIPRGCTLESYLLDHLSEVTQDIYMKHELPMDCWIPVIGQVINPNFNIDILHTIWPLLGNASYRGAFMICLSERLLRLKSQYDLINHYECGPHKIVSSDDHIKCPLKKLNSIMKQLKRQHVRRNDVIQTNHLFIDFNQPGMDIYSVIGSPVEEKYVGNIIYCPLWFPIKSVYDDGSAFHIIDPWMVSYLPWTSSFFRRVTITRPFHHGSNPDQPFQIHDAYCPLLTLKMQASLRPYHDFRNSLSFILTRSRIVTIRLYAYSDTFEFAFRSLRVYNERLNKKDDIVLKSVRLNMRSYRRAIMDLEETFMLTHFFELGYWSPSEDLNHFLESKQVVSL